MSEVPNQVKSAKPIDNTHTVPGRRLITLLDEYSKSIAVPSNDRNENLRRMKMLQTIVATACPSTVLDDKTATDVVRIFFDFMYKNWGKTLDETTVFRMGEHIKSTTTESDKITMFVEAFVQMVEGANEKKKVMFVTSRLKQVVKNDRIINAMTLIRDNINKRNGFE